MKKNVLLCLSSLLAIVVSISPLALAEGTVKVFLMAGQSNMEGNNTPADRLDVLICHANSDFAHATLTCGSTDIPTDELTSRFIDNSQILEGYHAANASGPDHPVVIRLGQFLCSAGKLDLAGQDCATLDFDLTGRYFATVCAYYYHAGNARFQWGYDPFKQMTTAMALTEIFDEGHLSDALISNRPDVTVLQFRASLQGDGTLSFAQRKGALNVGFGSGADRYGPELTFGHYMGDFLKDDVLLLKVVQGGTDLRVDWKTPCSTQNAGNNLTAEELAQASLYDALIERARQIQDPAILARYFPQYAGRTAQIAGFLWFQGWNDGLNDLNRNNYETNMTCLVNDIRTDLFLPELPIVIAQSHVGDPDNPVQLAQAKVADEFDHTELAPTDDLSGYYHFDNAAHLVIGQRMAKRMIALLELTNTSPVANDQNISMRAAELLGMPIKLAGYDDEGDKLTYTIESPPANGTLIGSDPNLEYLPDSTFRGMDSFTYMAHDAEDHSEIATVTIEVKEEPCTSDLIEGPTDSLFVHVPSHLVNAAISPHRHTVTLEGELRHESASSDPELAEHAPFTSRNDLTDKAILIDTNTSAVVPLTISFKFMPADDMQNQVILQSDAFVIEDSAGAVRSTFFSTGAGYASLTNSAGPLKTRSCNHFAVVLAHGKHISWLNGKPAEATVNTGAIKSIGGLIVVGPYPGIVWDIRIYKRALTPQEILELGGAHCSGELLATSPYEGYPNYLCGVYVCEWWPDGTDETMENYQYYLHAQDRVYERNFFEAGMYPNDKLCDYFSLDRGRDLKLSDGIRNSFVDSWDFSHPLRQSNGQHWLHENFHSYQGRLKGYTNKSGSKFMLESTASWGADHNIPGVRDTLLAYYSLHPHLPLWTIQNSPVDERAGHEFKGGHQYGAYIFWSYLTNYVVSKNLIGDIFNDARAGSRPAEAAYDLLAQQGHDMKAVFADFAARITTWDIRDGAAYADSEQASLRRMKSAKPEAETFDNKLTAVYDANGTGNQWTPVDERYIPGSWAFNAYRVDVARDAVFTIALSPDPANPAYTDFQGRVVVQDANDNCTYHLMPIHPAPRTSTFKVSASAGDRLYLVVASTPDIFRGWDWYRYQYKIHPESALRTVKAPTNLTAVASESLVSLDWDDNSEPDLSSYNVYRSTSSGAGFELIASALAESQYTDNQVIGDTEYYYAVTAVDRSSTESAHSNEAWAHPADTAPPGAPTSLSARAQDSRIALAWDNNPEFDLASYKIYRTQTPGTDYILIAEDITENLYLDQGLTNDTTYYYTVSAVDINGHESPPSAEVSATPGAISGVDIGLVAYWPFNGNADDHIGTNHGSLQANAPYVSGKFGQAIACSSQGGLAYVRLTREDSLQADWTVSAWMNVRNRDVGGFLCGGPYDIRCPAQFGASGQPGLTDTGNNINAAWDGSDSQSQTYIIPENTWTHMVFVGSDSDGDGATDQCELFADSVSQGLLIFAECRGTHGNATSGDPMDFPLTWNRIGDLDQYSGYGNSKAEYDDVAIWDRPLGAQEIAWLYNNGDGNPAATAPIPGRSRRRSRAWP